MKKIIISSMMLTACGAFAPQASAQSVIVEEEILVVETGSYTSKAPKFALKAYDNIGVGKSMTLNSTTNDLDSKSNYNAFGIDFGYTFWRKGPNSLEANIGVGYSVGSSTLSLPEMKYNYAAPASADEDGNPYQRYYEISEMKQKSTLGYVNIPIYLEYQYRPLKWLGLHAEVGVGLGFRVLGSVGKTSGNVYSYGIFPEYDDLLIDQDYLDDFGHRSLAQATSQKPSMKGFAASIMCGAGFEFYAYEPVSFEVGVRYNAGLTQCYNGKFNVGNPSEYTAETAPVTYTVADGQTVKALADYTSKSKMSPLSIHVGVNVRF